MAMCSACSPTSLTGTRILTSRAFGGLRFQHTFSSAVPAIFGNLSVATTAPGMPVPPLTGGEASAMTTRLALNWKDWKGTLSKHRSMKRLPACAQQFSRHIRWRILPDMSILRREERPIRALNSTGFCYKIPWLCRTGVFPKLLETVFFFWINCKLVRAFQATRLRTSSVEALKAFAKQNRRKAASALGMLKKSLIPSGLGTVSCQTNTQKRCQNNNKNSGWIQTTPSGDTLPVVVAAALDTRYSA